MRIRQITLPVSDPASVAHYFRDVLQLRVEENQVVIGWSTITLVPAAGRPLGGVHLAFNVPDNRFGEAMSWLRARTPLQRSPDGKDYFALQSHWQSQSVYFTGPDGLILELIGRRRLPASTRAGAFDGSEITCLSEVGLPVADVPSMQQLLAGTLALAPLSEPTPFFAPMGDDEGLLIVVDAARHWFPEQVDLPNAQGIVVTIETPGDAADVGDADHGWRVRSTSATA
ncbi:hypothetical protein ABB28_10195 [Stenotrophomonas chelatiphaga]|uniref:VOC domain-containing protein n=1 Tax=Stenotrophomonas chelatiphaga TaxID=517011 RepID=A0A0R0CWC2_9GAMM|nr:hypothetical protein [Stenotrophomonas chelatiphaga]KRG73536.1 hypothetical protein ABB28_10195 [Stenotrophomonas chelatiphaga]